MFKRASGLSFFDLGGSFCPHGLGLMSFADGAATAELAQARLPALRPCKFGFSGCGYQERAESAGF